MTELPFCPCCGHNLTPDKEVQLQGWTLTPDSAHYDGRRLRIQTCEAGFLYTLARAMGRCVKSEVIGNRIAVCDRPRLMAATMACRLRKKLPAMAVPVPFETIHNAGYRWCI